MVLKAQINKKNNFNLHFKIKSKKILIIIGYQMCWSWYTFHNRTEIICGLNRNVKQKGERKRPGCSKIFFFINFILK